jgi:hypothetical protein
MNIMLIVTLMSNKSVKDIAQHHNVMNGYGVIGIVMGKKKIDHIALFALVKIIRMELDMIAIRANLVHKNN